MVLNETSRLCICEVLWILILNLTIDFMLGCHSNSKLIKSVNWKIADSKVESKTCCCCCAVSPKCWTVRINLFWRGVNAGSRRRSFSHLPAHKFSTPDIFLTIFISTIFAREYFKIFSIRQLKFKLLPAHIFFPYTASDSFFSFCIFRVDLFSWTEHFLIFQAWICRGPVAILYGLYRCGSDPDQNALDLNFPFFRLKYNLDLNLEIHG